MTRKGQGEWMSSGLSPPLPCSVGGAAACRRLAGARALGQGRDDTQEEEKVMGQVGRGRGTVHLGLVHSASFYFYFLLLPFSFYRVGFELF
jgi:hypothetical protein